jgi:hypothetical protein
MKHKLLMVLLLVLSLIFPVGFAQAKSCESITFSHVTPDTFTCMKTKLQHYGISVPQGNSGKLSGHGIVGNFAWDGESKLTIQITKKPFFVSCQTADNEIKKFVDECIGS